MSHFYELSDGQQTALLAILNGLPFTVAARAAGVDRRTLHRWRTEDEGFRKAHRAASDDTFGDTLALLKARTLRAVEVLTSAMDDSRVSPRRVAAANATLRHALKAVEVLEVKEKQREIERFMRQLEERRELRHARQDF